MNKKEEQAIKSLICGGLQAIQMGVEDALKSGINCKMPDAVVFKVWIPGVDEISGDIEFVVPFTSQYPGLTTEGFTNSAMWVNREAEVEVAGTA